MAPQHVIGSPVIFKFPGINIRQLHGEVGGRVSVSIKSDQEHVVDFHRGPPPRNC
jgi:hypothetical protein